MSRQIPTKTASMVKRRYEKLLRDGGPSFHAPAVPATSRDDIVSSTNRPSSSSPTKGSSSPAAIAASSAGTSVVPGGENDTPQQTNPYIDIDNTPPEPDSLFSSLARPRDNDSPSISPKTIGQPGVHGALPIKQISLASLTSDVSDAAHAAR